MDTWDAVRSRLNVREYQSRAIEDQVLDRILEAGRRTPSAGNRQWWDLVVVTDRGQLEQLAQVWRGGGHVARSAATIALVAPVEDDPSKRQSIHYDLGQLTMSIMLQAASEGVGSCHSAVEDKALARSILGHPEDLSCEYLIAIGYPADREMAPLTRINRRPFGEVVHRGGW